MVEQKLKPLLAVIKKQKFQPAPDQFAKGWNKAISCVTKIVKEYEKWEKK